jgi:hypothetical protein
MSNISENLVPNMKTSVLVNPETKRVIKVGSATHLKLISKGLLSDETLSIGKTPISIVNEGGVINV